MTDGEPPKKPPSIPLQIFRVIAILVGGTLVLGFLVFGLCLLAFATSSRR